MAFGYAKGYDKGRSEKQKETEKFGFNKGWEAREAETKARHRVAPCHECLGTGVCPECHGSASSRKLGDPGPVRGCHACDILVVTDECPMCGASLVAGCGACGGRRRCPECNGSGKAR